jgi:hypothetical protein
MTAGDGSEVGEAEKDTASHTIKQKENATLATDLFTNSSTDHVQTIRWCSIVVIVEAILLVVVILSTSGWGLFKTTLVIWWIASVMACLLLS